MMGRFSQFMQWLEEVYASPDQPSFAYCYRTAIRGAKLAGFAIPSECQAKRILIRDLAEWASKPLRGAV